MPPPAPAARPLVTARGLFGTKKICPKDQLGLDLPGLWRNTPAR